MDPAVSRAFSGKWITTKEFAVLKAINVFHKQLDKTPVQKTAYTNKHILFRRTFNCDATDKACIYITADDYYKLYINGQFVTQGPAPAYYFHYGYNKVDVSEYLMPGENVIAVHTYYQGLINRVWTSGDNRHGLILDLECDGKVILSSDESFLCAYHTGYSVVSTCGYNTQYLERYDAGVPEVNFEALDYDCGSWEHAVINYNDDHTLFEQTTKQLVFEEIAPTEIRKTDFGYYIDFGSTYVGYPVFSAKGRKSDIVTIMCGQELADDGRVRFNIRAGCKYEEKMVLSGGNERMNQYDYITFRYMELVVPDGCTVDADSIKLNARHYPFVLKAKPNTDDPELLQIWDLCSHSIEYGVQEVIHDCMDREKGFYLGDGCYTVLTQALLTGDYSMMRKLIDDALRTSFITEGLVTCIDCSHMQEIAEYSLMLIPLVWVYYKLTGSKECLEQTYSGLESILEYYRRSYENDDGLLGNLDKWCVVEWPASYRDGYDVCLQAGTICETPHCALNAYYNAAVRSLNFIARIIGRKEYRNAEEMKANFVKAFYIEESKTFRDSIVSTHSSFPANIFAFAFGLCPDSESEEKIISMIKERTITSAMFYVTFPALFALKIRGMTELVEEQMKNPGAWLRMLREGATTTFEGWGKDTKWNTSLFHLTFSYGAVFLCDDLWDKLLENCNSLAKKARGLTK